MTLVDEPMSNGPANDDEIMEKYKYISALSSLLVILTTIIWSQNAFAAEGKDESESHAKLLLAGASQVNINPEQLPVYLAGGFIYRKAHSQLDNLYAKAIILDDGENRIAIAVVDSTALPRELIDAVKRKVNERTGLRSDQIMISATHTHSAPNARRRWGNEESEANDAYIRLLEERIALGIERAMQSRVPARVGWAVTEYADGTYPRRYIRRPDKMSTDPFGEPTVRTNMHPGYQNPDVIGPAGPKDPQLSILSIQTLQGRPIAVFANYAVHYYGAPNLIDGSPLISADYFGLFATKIADLIESNREKNDPPFIAIMSQGASGDQEWMDYDRPRLSPAPGLDGYSEIIAKKAYAAYRGIVYREWMPVKTIATELTLKVRAPSQRQWNYAEQVIAKMGDRQPSSVPERYANDLVSNKDDPPDEKIIIQTIRLGDVALVAIPAEVFALTGLKIKAYSPAQATIIVGLANGANGYLPPPEQHVLGGYETWVRPHYLAAEAEPIIVESTLKLLEDLFAQRRRAPADSEEPYSKVILSSRPLAYWRLNELNGPMAPDATGRHAARYEWEKGIAFYLQGPQLRGYSQRGAMNRAPHLAGGRLITELRVSSDIYSVELWFWSGLPSDARPITGWLLSIGSDSLGIGGTAGSAGKLTFVCNGKTVGISNAVIVPKLWNHVIVVRNKSAVTVHLNGDVEIDTRLDAAGIRKKEQPLVLGGNSNYSFSFEGRLDEVSVYERALTDIEVVDHFRLATN